MKFFKFEILIILFLIFIKNYLAKIEWFNKIDPNDKSKLYHDKTIPSYEFFTPSKLICIKKCLSLNSSCQFFEHTIQGICSFFDQDQLNNLFPNNRIDIIQSGLRLIVPFAFEKCKQVQVLNISFNNLKQIYSKSFYGMFKLRVLLIDSNNMSNLESDVFQDVPLLNNLNLKDNLIKNLDDNLFDYSRELVTIHLGSNQIEWLDRGIFKNLRKLKYLFINNNRLKILEPLFDNLESLEFLDVSFNQIDTIQNDTFKNLKQIKKIYITDKQLPEINSETFKGAYNLENLRMSINKIQRIYENFSKDFQNLTELDLSHNNLSFIKPEFFNGFLKLEHLRLYNCSLKNIELNSLVNLKVLLLTANQIKYFSQNLSALTHLYLYANPLVNLSFPLISSESSSLQFLDISSCQLKFIDFGVLKNLTNLETLKMVGNPITLDSQSFIGFKNLKNVDVDFLDVPRLKSFFPNINFT
ncbi:unnamed protein product [Brachionus calyciflorus]|uniref:Uncharacterized protein n=1 Tax=Brachionus calyciflorus TaxID=104777 RepID=A0A814DAW3_9BILA|nr:unnamed protein product [Brachionus calyciflorus]